MIGKSGGQLLIWDPNLFEAIDVIKFDRVLGVCGKWKSNGFNLNILNVYGPHDDEKKKLLWDSLANLISGTDEAWAICGDLNEVRDQTEHFNCEFVANRARWFNDFILHNNLIDIPLGGRAYTRLVLERRESDHCPMVLKDEDKNYGPKPFKIFDAWYDDESSEQVISEAWSKDSSQGSRLDRCFLKKLKSVKAALKDWSRQKFGQIDGDIELHKKIA
ncbi:uncharacterized protein [Rutidosis leptorrhynchoides]|uniref:uncharacterized protein n=1 Tax=Rutidosis leptorrhynchoides TaxID=125765 RepID=UPI003A996F89